MPKWEYLFVWGAEDCTKENLNKLGREGWEVVSVDWSDRYARPHQVLLKRPLTEK